SDGEPAPLSARLQLGQALAVGDPLRDRLVERQRRRLRLGGRAGGDRDRDGEEHVSHRRLPVINSMKTSSSEAAIGRTLTSLRLAPRTAASIAAITCARAPGSIRTWARSPKVWTSFTPGTRARISPGGRARDARRLRSCPT